MPFWITTVRTHLPPAEVEERLRRVVRPVPRGFVWVDRPPEGSLFRGTISGRRFKVVRVIRYRNSFQPISGSIEAEPAGRTTIRLRMRLHAGAALFMAVWTTMVSSMFREEFLVPLGMLAFMAVVVCASFFIEARRAVRVIGDCVSADP